MVLVTFWSRPPLAPVNPGVALGVIEGAVGDDIVEAGPMPLGRKMSELKVIFFVPG